MNVGALCPFDALVHSCTTSTHVNLRVQIDTSPSPSLCLHGLFACFMVLNGEVRSVTAMATCSWESLEQWLIAWSGPAGLECFSACWTPWSQWLLSTHSATSLAVWCDSSMVIHVALRFSSSCLWVFHLRYLGVLCFALTRPFLCLVAFRAGYRGTDRSCTQRSYAASTELNDSSACSSFDLPYNSLHA